MRKNNKKLPILIFIIICFIIIGIIVYIFINKYNNRRMESTSQDIKDYLNINIEKIDADNIEYFIEQKDVAGAIYQKAFMSYILKSSTNPKKELVDNDRNWGTNILMYCKLNDGKEIQVVSNVDMDDISTMRAQWTDGNTYFSMITHNLTTREEFLQEINKVVLANHIIETQAE